MSRSVLGINYDKWILIWLIAGLIMVYFQIIIGGITRLTGSGLSITEWEIVTGTLPPLTEGQWLVEFDKYKQTPQYEKINLDMQMGSIFTAGTFKFIYFWEYLHRLWARMMGFVFLIPFIFLVAKRRLSRSVIRRLGVVVLLAGLAATFGWIMVASGLINRPWVNAYKLALHLCIGISVFMALWWTVIRYIYRDDRLRYTGVSRALKILCILLVLQIFLGGVMSGTKAALFINTWPDMNGEMIPTDLFQSSNWSYANFNNYESSPFLVTLIQFLHRTLAYIISLFVLVYLFKSKLNGSSRSGVSYLSFTGLIVIQVIVGILTLKYSIGIVPVYLGVVHQAVAVLVLASLILHMFYSAFNISREEIVR